MKNFYCLYAFLILTFLPEGYTTAQERIPLHSGVYDTWKAIHQPMLSNNGTYTAFAINPQYGDGLLIIYNNKTNTTDTIYRGYDAAFAADDSFAAFKIKPLLRQTRKAKLDGKKKEDMPQDSLGIWTAEEGLIKFPLLKSFEMAAEGQANMIALLKPFPTAADSAKKNDSTEKKEAPAKKAGKKEKPKELYDLLLISSGKISGKIENVSKAVISENGAYCAYIQQNTDSLKKSVLRIKNTNDGNTFDILEKEGTFGKIAIDREGEQLAFLLSTDTTEHKRYRLYYFRNKVLQLLADTSDLALGKLKSVSDNGSLYFSGDGSKLYFGIAPTPRAKVADSLTEDEKAKVDVWHYLDARLQPEQLKQLDADRKRTQLSVFHTRKNRLVVLEDDTIQQVSPGFKGNGDFALGFENEKYRLQASWSGERYRDVFLIHNLTGKKDLLLKKQNGPVQLSESGKYLAWYSSADSSWRTMEVSTRKATRHKPENTAFYDEEHDVSGTPGAYGSAGFTADERFFIVYDYFDLWALPLSDKQQAVNLTSGKGRKEKIRFRNVKLNQDVPYAGDKNYNFLLSSFEKESKKAGFYSVSMNKEPVKLIDGEYKFGTPVKARNSEMLLWTKGNFNIFPDLYLSDSLFSNTLRLSDANPQQSDYKWGNVELHSWLSSAGETLQGLIYKPENFDVSKKYPMLVYFYEKSSDNLYQHYTPRPSRSIINPAYCVSNDYVVFVPDINYTDGYPGQSAYESVISGTLSVINQGYIDETKIGLQGQSWGGYQVAWLITRTPMFKAAMAGAPVSNMTSAYGGIRWESGMVRQFQYEAGQSRIGADLWSRPDLYIENSPLFRADKIETPLLIMSNDGDGAVPWYQGIELFTAMRRLGKPAWLLNYNGDEHNLTKRGNMKDLDRRMMEFFDHYLKNAPAPKWMTEGVPATEKQ